MYSACAMHGRLCKSEVSKVYVQYKCPGQAPTHSLLGKPPMMMPSMFHISRGQCSSSYCNL